MHTFVIFQDPTGLYEGHELYPEDLVEKFQLTLGKGLDLLQSAKGKEPLLYRVLSITLEKRFIGTTGICHELIIQQVPTFH